MSKTQSRAKGPGIAERLFGTGQARLQNMKPYQSPRKAFPDLLNYAALVADGVVLTKAGSLIGGFYYRGRDLTSSTAAERNYVTERINAALVRLGGGWSTWMDAVRVPAPAYPDPARSHFPDVVTALIDEERRAAFDAEGAHYESEYALIVQYMPPKTAEQGLGEAMYDDDMREKETAQKLRERQDAVLAKFQEALGDLGDFMGDSLRMRRMRSHRFTVNGQTVLRDDLVTYLHFCISGVVQPVNIPAVPMYLDQLIGGYECWPGNTPKIGDRFVGVVGIGGFPSELHPNILDVLDHLAIPYRWSSRMIYLDQHEGENALERFRRKWSQKQRGFFSQVFRTNGRPNTDAVAMVQELDGALHDAKSGLVAFGYYTPVVIVHGTTRAQTESWCKSIQSVIRQIGFTARVETVNAMDAYHGSLPGHTFPNVRRPIIHTLNLSDLLPTAGVWPGAASNPCPFFPKNSPPLLHASTDGSTPFRLNLHVADVGHTLIFGPTGAGKSTLLGTLLAQFRRYEKATCVVFDKGRSMLPLTLAVGGQHYDLASEGDTTGLCPLQHLDTEADVSWAVSWLGTMFELQAEVAPTPRQREEIFRAVTVMRSSKHSRSLTDFVATVQDETVRSAFGAYTMTGPLGTLLDAEQDGLRTASVTTFELEELMTLGHKNVIPVLLLLFRRFEKMLTGQPALLVLDEAWMMLGHPVFREKIREWLKVLRKANCSVVLATQSLSDAANSGIFDVLIESCPTKILLPNEEADKSGGDRHSGPRELYAMMGLNDTEIGILKTARRRRQYYYTSPDGRRVFDLNLGPVALAFVGVSDKPQIARVKALAQQHGADWPFAWLNELGVNYEKFIAEKQVA